MTKQVIGLDTVVQLEIRTTFGGVLVVTDGPDGVRVEYRAPSAQKDGGDEVVLPGEAVTAAMLIPVPAV